MIMSTSESGDLFMNQIYRLCVCTGVYILSDEAEPLQMTSVLYSAGLNYQGGNPLRTEIRGLRASITALEALAQDQASQIAALKAQTAALEKAVRAVTAATAATAATANAVANPVTSPPLS
jgi:hypothetical protein